MIEIIKNILRLLYDFVFLLGFLMYLPVYIWRKKITLASLKEKLGFIPGMIEGRCIWIQVVSVGEAHLIGALVNRLHKEYNFPLVISATTLTGNKVLRKKYSSLARIIFFPLDISFVVRRVIKKLKPKLFITVETEIWPNLFYHLKRQSVPIIIVNGRISRRAFRKYKVIVPVMRRILDKCDYIGVQNTHYKERFLALGGKEEKIFISGNMKFEGISVDENMLQGIRTKYEDTVTKNGQNIVIIAGSTHYPEEKIIVDVYNSLIERYHNLSLVIAPRHIEGIESIEKMVASKGSTSFRMSEVGRAVPTAGAIFLLDTIGELAYFYTFSDICFVGGSLVRHGGHNILEPIYFLKPTCFGPSMDNFKDIEEIVLDKGAGIRVEDRSSLQEAISRLITDQALRSTLKDKCQQVFEEEKHSLDNNLKMIASLLSR